MALTLYYHPFSSFCQKALIALYENDIPFEKRVIDLSDAQARAALESIWPLAKFPVLRDEGRGITVPEASLIVAYLADHYPGEVALIPRDRDAALQVHILDRLIDNYILLQVTKIVTDRFRPEDGHDPVGVEQAKALIAKAYAILEDRLSGADWAAGRDFTLADCAAAPALFYSNIVVPFAGHPRIAAYYRRLLGRPSFARCVEEARPFRALFPIPWPADYA